jgi:hypothetical protein
MMKNLFNKSKLKKQQPEPEQAEATHSSIEKDFLLQVLELPVFGNTITENFNEFIEKFESLTTTTNNENKTQLLLFRLHGDAAQKIKPYLSTTPTYHDLVMILKQECPAKYKLEMDIKDHATTIRKEVNKEYPNSSGYNEKSRERLMINKVIERLPESLKENLQLQIQKFTTLQQLMDYVTTLQ